MKPADLVAQLCIRSFEPPLSELRENGAYRDLTNPVVVLLLLFDFITEVEMNGIAGFLCNSTGRYLDETAGAFEAVGCPNEATKFRDLVQVASATGLTRTEGGGSGCQIDEEKIAEGLDDIDRRVKRIHFAAVSEAMEEYAEKHRAVVEFALRS